MLYKLYSGFLHVFGLIALFSLWMPRTSGVQIKLIPESPKIGGTVLLNVIGVNSDIRTIAWYKGDPSAPNQILSYIPSFPDPMTKGSKYFPEVKCFPNGSLQIVNLAKSFDGDYTVQIQTTTVQQATVNLSVNGVGYVGVSAPLLFLGVLITSILHMT